MPQPQPQNKRKAEQIAEPEPEPKIRRFRNEWAQSFDREAKRVQKEEQALKGKPAAQNAVPASEPKVTFPL